MTATTQGPNVKRLIVEKMSTDAIPPGGGFADGLKFLMDPERIKAGAKAATEFVRLAISAVREAAEPNPWKLANDEEIAGEILRGIRERQIKRSPWKAHEWREWLGKQRTAGTEAAE